MYHLVFYTLLPDVTELGHFIIYVFSVLMDHTLCSKRQRMYIFRRYSVAFDEHYSRNFIGSPQFYFKDKIPTWLVLLLSISHRQKLHGGRRHSLVEVARSGRAGIWTCNCIRSMLSTSRPDCFCTVQSLPLVSAKRGHFQMVTVTMNSGKSTRGSLSFQSTLGLLSACRVGSASLESRQENSSYDADAN